MPFCRISERETINSTGLLWLGGRASLIILIRKIKNPQPQISFSIQLSGRISEIDETPRLKKKKKRKAFRPVQTICFCTFWALLCLADRSLHGAERSGGLSVSYCDSRRSRGAALRPHLRMLCIFRGLLAVIPAETPPGASPLPLAGSARSTAEAAEALPRCAAAHSPRCHPHRPRVWPRGSPGVPPQPLSLCLCSFGSCR